MMGEIEIRCVCSVIFFDREQWNEHKDICDAYRRANARRSYWQPPKQPAHTNHGSEFMTPSYDGLAAVNAEISEWADYDRYTFE